MFVVLPLQDNLEWSHFRSSNTDISTIPHFQFESHLQITIQFLNLEKQGKLSPLREVAACAYFPFVNGRSHFYNTIDYGNVFYQKEIINARLS